MNKIFHNNSQKGSSRNIFLIIIAILLVGGAFVFAEYRNNQANKVYVAQKIDVVTADLGAEDDSDNDGMKDWEEILMGTDPHDPKSKTSLSSKASIEKDLTKENQEKLTQTDLISRDFFARYMELRQLGSASDATTQQELAARTVGKIVLPEPNSYKLSDILTKEDNSKEAVKQYGNEIGAIFAKNSINSRNEAVIAKEAIDTDNFEILKEIDPIIASYKGIINSLLKLKVPKAIDSMHLDLINAMNSGLFVAQSFRNSDTDPIAAIQAVNLYLPTEKQLTYAVSAIKSYFSYLGIMFEPAESGYLFRTS